MVALLIALATASVVQGTVVLLPVDVVGFGAQAGSRRAEVEQALGAVLGPNLKRAAPGAPACDKAACFQALAAEHGADEIAVLRLEKRDGDAFAAIGVQVFDAEGAAIVALREPLPQRDLEPALRGIFTRAFDASAHGGRIEVVGVAPDEELLIDGLPPGPGMALLSVGRHVVIARDTLGRERRVDVDVAWGATQKVVLPARLAPEEAAPLQRPLWPAVTAFVTGALGVVVLGAASGIAIQDLSLAGTARAAAEASNLERQPVGSSDPARSEWREGYGVRVDEGRATNAAQLRWHAMVNNSAVANETAAAALIATAVVGGLVAVAGGVTGLLLWPASTSSEPE